MNTYPSRDKSGDSLLLSVLISFFYSIVIVLFPWDLISKDGFPDFDTYIENFDYYILTGTSRIQLYNLTNVIQFFTNEVLWNELVLALHGFTGNTAVALRICSFFILFINSLFLLRYVGFKYSLLFLLNPSVIDVAMSGIRNGLAWTLIIIGVWGRSEIIRFLLFVASVFIHSSSIVLFFLYYLLKTASIYFKERILLFIGLFSGVVVGLALTVFNEIFAGAIADRRFGSDYIVGGASFKPALIWTLLLLIQCTCGIKYIKENIFAISVITWYLVMTPFLPSSYRIWAALMPLIALSIANLPLVKRHIFLIAYACYLSLHYFYWSHLFSIFNTILF